MNTSEPVISVQQVSKDYRIWNSPSARLSAPILEGVARIFPTGSGLRTQLQRQAAKNYRDFQALTKISFEIARGDSMGIIGRNGSGKSTLLQIIAGTLQPSAGSAKVNGRVAALLELGSGFNPEFTGRENVFLTGTIMGLTKGEMQDRFAEIEAFAEIGDFIEQPVKTYSSGMMVRLAFAVQTAVKPDVLIVDEALSVGDFFFQQKCFSRIRELRKQGTTLLFVSHDMASVRDLCSRALYLNQGKDAFCGNSAEAIARYHREVTGPQLGYSHIPNGGPRTETASSDNLSELTDDALWKASEKTSELQSNDAPAELIAVELLDRNGNHTLKHQMGDTATVRAYFRAKKVGTVHAALELRNRHNQLVSSLSTRLQNQTAVSIRPGQTWSFELQIKLQLEAGQYSFQVALGHPYPKPNVGNRFTETPWLGPLTIYWDYSAQDAPFLGMFGLPVDIHLRNLTR